MKNRIITWFSVIISFSAIILSVIIYFTNRYTDNLEMQISERDSLINKLAISDKLVSDYFDITIDTTQNTTSYVLKVAKVEEIVSANEDTFIFGDKTLTADDVAFKYNNLVKEYNDLWSAISKVEDKNILLVSGFKKINDMYNEINYEYRKLINDHNTIVNENRTYESILNMIKNKYDIDYSIKKTDSTSIISLHPSPKIDSALILLPHFRDRLTKTGDSEWTTVISRHISE